MQKVKPNIVRRGDKFYVYLKLHGKMKWFAAGTSIRQAQRKLDDLRSERNNGTYQEIKKIRFKAIAELWFESYVKTKVKPSYTLTKLKNWFGTTQYASMSALRRFSLLNPLPLSGSQGLPL